jgi:hypothetical protein
VADAKISPPDKNGFRMPAVPGIEARTKSFIQKAEHAVQGVFQLCCVFYPELRSTKGWFDGFSSLVEKRFDAGSDHFVPFAKDVADLAKQIRNVRNSIEHKDPTKWVELRDYQMTADRVLEEPTIQVVHSVTPIDQVPITRFMEEIVGGLLDTTELLMAYLADRYIAPGKFRPRVGEIPENQRDGDGNQIRLLDQDR